MHPCPRPAHLVFAVGMLFCSAASAGESAKPMATIQPVASTGMPVFVSNIAPEAIDAVKVVDAFSTAIKQVKLEDAANLLDPKVLILESGSSERSRDEYMQSHAIADAAFMQTAEQQLRYRQAQAEGNIAWVGTESIVSRMNDGKPMHLLSTETMILRKGSEGWKIVHIHWSSRPAPNS